MNHTGISKLIAVVSVLAILASQITVSARLSLTADSVIDGTQNGGAGMLSGFAMDSKDYAFSKIGKNYGEYHEHLSWSNNLLSTGWNAKDSINIYPVGTPETNYMDIDDPQSFSEAPYANFTGYDIEFWNGYMLIVLGRVTQTEDAAYMRGIKTTFESAIQIWDVANGAKTHVATWDVADFDFGGTDAAMSYGIRDIEINDEKLFMLVDMCSPGWEYNDAGTWGGALAVFDHAISRENDAYPIPTKSALQQQIGENDRKNHGIDRQWLMRMRGETMNASEFCVLGDYLVYVPSAGGGTLKEDNAENGEYTQGIHIAKWNNSDRNPTDLIEFSHQSIRNWLNLSFPAEYHGTEAHGADFPELKRFMIEDHYAYLNIVYTAPPVGGDVNAPIGDWVQYDLLYIVDIADPTNPVIVGQTAPIQSPNGVQSTGRKMTVADGYVYIGHEHWNPSGYEPYLYIINVENKANPRHVQSLRLRQYINDSDQTFGVDAVTALGDYIVLQLRDHWTVFLKMSADKTRVLDYCYKKYTMSWGALSGGASEPLVYGKRIFYPSLRGVLNTPVEGDVDPETGLWGEESVNGALFRYLNRIEVIDFSQALPKGIYVEDIQDHQDETFTISGTVQGVQVIPALYDSVAIEVTNTNTKQSIDSIYFEELDTEADIEADVAKWSYTTNEFSPAKLTFTLYDENGENVPGAYAEVVLDKEDTGSFSDSKIDETKLKIFVDFEKEYPDYENNYTVWGEYSGTEAETMQIVSAVYGHDGMLLQAKLSEPIYLMPQESFSIEDSILLDENCIVEDAVLKVFAWSSTYGIRPLGQVFKVTDTAFSYTLYNPARTSAGVFDADGNLIRTLWSGLEEDAGTYTKTWDGFDDNGVLQTDGEYTITVMENNVQVVADAFIGNSSDHSHRDYIISGFANFFSDMVYLDGNVFYIYPYSEGKQSVYYFNQNNPDRKVAEFGGSNRCMQRAVTDGNRLYCLNTEIGRDRVYRTFVYAFDLSSKQMYMFGNRGTWLPSWGIDNHYYGVNVVSHDGSLFQTGNIGVQTNGNMLFTSYVAEGKVYVLNKNTGELIHSQNFNQPRALAYNENGGLWIGYQKGDGRYIAERYNVANNGQLTRDDAITLEHDFGYLLHLELSPDGKKIVAADGSTNQYKMYSTETGRLLWTFGSNQSYEEDPTVYADKLMLKYTSNETDLVYSEFENDTTLWIGDEGNNRAYKLDISGLNPVIIDEIMTQPGSHSLGVDATNPTTVYSNAVQYEMDYTKSGRESWKMVKNWKKQVEAFGLDIVTFNQFNNMITLPNGKTYFSAYYDGTQKLFCFEDNYIRNTGINFDGKIMMDDGTVGSISPDSDNMAVYKLHQITGYNQAGDPIIDSEGQILAKLPVDRNEPTHVFGGMKLNMPISENNIMMTLRCVQQPDVNDKKTWHIGGVKVGDGIATDWQWKAAPEGSEHYDGNFPKDGTFEGGNGVLNSAMKIVANGQNVVFQYNGEFYKQAQSNGLYFYRDNGLLVGVFGDAAYQRQTNENRDQYGKEIFPGNAFDLYFIQDPQSTDRAYILQNNENGFGNFKYNVTGLDTIQEHTSTVDLQNALWDGLEYRYYTGDSRDPANMIVRDWRKNITNEPYVEGDDFTMRYTGYIQNPNRSANLKLHVNAKETIILTIDGQQLVNGTGSTETEIYLEPGKLYAFSCDIKKSESTAGGTTRFTLGYYDDSGRLQLFTDAQFKTDKLPYMDSAVIERDLLEGLPFASVLDSGAYGITRGTPSNVGGAGLNTNGTNASFDDVRDIRFGVALMSEDNAMWPRSAWFAKNLGTPRDNLHSWEIDMDVSRYGYINYGELGNPQASTGMHIDVLDINDKVIARFYWAKENKTYGNNQFIYQCNNLYNNNLNSELYTVSGQYDNDFNTQSPLTIRGIDGNIIFEYYGKRVVTQVMDADAQWDKPLKLKVDAFYYYDNGNAREMNISITKLNYKQYLTE